MWGGPLVPTPPPSAKDEPGPGPRTEDVGGLGGFRARHPHLCRFVMMLGISIAIGIGVEKGSEFVSKNTEATRAHFVKLESDAVSGINSVKPSTAFHLFEAAQEPSAESQAKAAERGWEGSQRLPVKNPQPHPVFNPENYRSRSESDTGVRLGHWGGVSGIAGALRIPVAFVDVVFHLLISGTIITRVLVLGQIALGASAMTLIVRWLMRRWLARYAFESYGWFVLFGFCFGTFAIASGSAYATGLVITAAQAAFGTLGNITGVSIGIGSVSGCCVVLVQKSFELGLHNSAEHILEKLA